MKRFSLPATLAAGFATVVATAVAAAVVTLAGCASTPPATPAVSQTAPPAPDYKNTYLLDNANRPITADAASRPPRLTVGVSDPDTQLILPWFLNDVINLVNYH